MPKLPFNDKGPVQVVWDPGGIALILNPVFGTVSQRTSDSVSDVQEEGWGETPVDSVFTGTVVELDVPLTRSEMSMLISLLPGVESGAGDVRAIFSAKAGSAMYEDARDLLLKPLVDGEPVSDSKKWIHILKTYPYRDLELPFDRDSQRVHLVHFKVFPDMSSGREGELYEYGYNV